MEVTLRPLISMCNPLAPIPPRPRNPQPHASNNHNREKGQKCVQQDVAIAMWQLLLPAHRWRYTQDWCDFLQAKHNRAISRDTWNQLLDFILSVSPDFSDYDDAGAWPYLIDEFVEHMREKQQQQ